MINDVLNVDGKMWPLKYDPQVHQGHVLEVDNFAAPMEMLLTMMMPSGLPEWLGKTLFGDNRSVLRVAVGPLTRVNIVICCCLKRVTGLFLIH
jgi:hypothetical protein